MVNEQAHSKLLGYQPPRPPLKRMAIVNGVLTVVEICGVTGEIK